jgi:hypothetical protein
LFKEMVGTVLENGLEGELEIEYNKIRNFKKA